MDFMAAFFYTLPTFFLLWLLLWVINKKFIFPLAAYAIALIYSGIKFFLVLIFGDNVMGRIDGIVFGLLVLWVLGILVFKLADKVSRPR